MKRTAPLIGILLAACRPAGTADVSVTDAWARATDGGQKTSAAYLTIANSGGADDALIGVDSSSGLAALHSSSMDGGIMRMRRLDRLTIPARSTVRLEPAGVHLMVSGLEQPLGAGSAIQLALRFEESGERRIAARVRGLEESK